MTGTQIPEEACTVAVVGGGTAGLSVATELMNLKIGKVIVLEREAEAGGVPRHCAHYPFGLREYKRILKGTEYARRNWELAVESGVDLRTNTTVTRLCPGGLLEVTAGRMISRLQADRVVLCMGVRESSRAQRFIGGDRPHGVISTGALQEMVYLKGIRPFKRPVILGSEWISFSAVQTCEHLGIWPVAMVEEQQNAIVRKVLIPYLFLKRIPLYTGAKNLRIVGADQVEFFEFEDDYGILKCLQTDGIIVSGRFRPEAALLRGSHIEIDLGTGGPLVDQFGRCSDPVYFCAGNLLRPAETSSFCSGEGIQTARRVERDLKREASPETVAVPFSFSDPAIQFVVPQRLTLTDETGGMDKFYLGLKQKLNGRIIVRSGKRLLWAGHIRSRPVRRILLPLSDILDAQSSLPVEITIERKG